MEQVYYIEVGHPDDIEYYKIPRNVIAESLKAPITERWEKMVKHAEKIDCPYEYGTDAFLDLLSNDEQAWREFEQELQSLETTNDSTAQSKEEV